MSLEIMPSSLYAKSLKEKYEDFEVPSYKLREWFSKTDKVFFDCEESDKSSCLELILKQRNLVTFVIFFVVREKPSGSYKFMDASFRNLGKETLKHFIRRYHGQLESMTKLGLGSRGIEYVECVGYSYELSE
ncbi:MAG: hypothetical protein ACE5HG_00040 [Candidatus Bathyarchaeia archaeon]